MEYICDEIEKIYNFLKEENLKPLFNNNQLTVHIPITLPKDLPSYHKNEKYTHHTITYDLPNEYNSLKYLEILNNILDCKKYGLCPKCNSNVHFGHFFHKYVGFECEKCDFAIEYSRHWNSWS